MYCEIVYFIEENNCEKRHADLKPRGCNCFWIDPIGTCNTGLREAPLAGRTEAFDHLSRFIASQKPLRTQLMPSCLQGTHGNWSRCYLKLRDWRRTRPTQPSPAYSSTSTMNWPPPRTEGGTSTRHGTLGPS